MREADAQRAAFLRTVLLEVARECGICDADVAAEVGPDVAEPDRDWFRALLRLLDRSTLAGTASIALFIDDVHRYLTHVGVRDVIDSRSGRPSPPGVETVVVGHSLGSVVTYLLLRQEGAALGWHVPCTSRSARRWASARSASASPRSRTPPARPGGSTPRIGATSSPCTRSTRRTSRSSPRSRTRTDVDNTTPDRHGIRGYLTDPAVACRIHRALTG